jgi:phosphatidylglycerol lysyltransferase
MNSLERARSLVLQWGWNAMCYQILNDGMEHWFSAQHDAVVGFARFGRWVVVAGAPVCPKEILINVVSEFEETMACARLKVCYFGAGKRLGDALAARGPWDKVRLGMQPIWEPVHGQTWEGILCSKPSLRAQLHRAQNKGVEVQEWPSALTVRHPALQHCLRQWLATRGLPALHFLVEPYLLDCASDRRVFVAVRQERVVGYLLASPVPQRKGWLVEQIIRGEDAPNGCNELLFDAAMRQFTVEQAEYVTLGLSPLATPVGERNTTAGLPPQQRWWIHLVFGLVRLHGARFYNFRGLEAFKAKFQPDAWEPIYAITGRHSFTPATLYAIAGVFGRTSPLKLVARAIAAALQKEWKALL